jgi:hypothetical protein
MCRAVLRVCVCVCVCVYGDTVRVWQCCMPRWQHLTLYVHGKVLCVWCVFGGVYGVYGVYGGVYGVDGGVYGTLYVHGKV